MPTVEVDIDLSRFYLMVINQESTSAFSCAWHSRPRTSLQFRLNHFSTLVWSVKRSALRLGERGLMTLPVTICLLGWFGGFSWHEAQLHSWPCFVLNNCSPLDAEAFADWSSYFFNSSCGVAEKTKFAKLKNSKTKRIFLTITNTSLHLQGCLG